MPTLDLYMNPAVSLCSDWWQTLESMDSMDKRRFERRWKSIVWKQTQRNCIRIHSKASEHWTNSCITLLILQITHCSALQYFAIRYPFERYFPFDFQTIRIFNWNSIFLLWKDNLFIEWFRFQLRYNWNSIQGIVFNWKQQTLTAIRNDWDISRKNFKVTRIPSKSLLVG